MEILVKNIMKTADDNKLFLVIFERTYELVMVYVCISLYFLWLWHVSIKSNYKGCDFAFPT